MNIVKVQARRTVSYILATMLLVCKDLARCLEFGEKQLRLTTLCRQESAEIDWFSSLSVAYWLLMVVCKGILLRPLLRQICILDHSVSFSRWTLQFLYVSKVINADITRWVRYFFSNYYNWLNLAWKFVLHSNLLPAVLEHGSFWYTNISQGSVVTFSKGDGIFSNRLMHYLYISGGKTL